LSDYTIRPRQAKDYRNGLPEVTELVSPDDKHMNGDAARIHDLTGCAMHRYVAVHEGEVIGTATLLTHPKLLHGGCKAGQIEEVAVREDWRGKGVGTDLVNTLMQLAKERGCYKVELKCVSELTSLYEQSGFYLTRNVTMRWNCG